MSKVKYLQLIEHISIKSIKSLDREIRKNIKWLAEIPGLIKPCRKFSCLH